MRTRMVSFQRHVQRLARIVRQAAADSGKRAELIVEGASGELDRQVLERMLPPFEHMLRNAVVHGIETPEERRARGKGESGTIHLDLQREGAEVIVEVSDDGAGMKLSAIRDKGAGAGTDPARSVALGRGRHAADPGAGLLHGRLAHAAGRSRRRHGRGGHRNQEARRRAAHGEHAGPGHALHDPSAVHAGDQPCAGRAHRR